MEYLNLYYPCVNILKTVVTLSAAALRPAGTIPCSLSQGSLLVVSAFAIFLTHHFLHQRAKGIRTRMRGQKGLREEGCGLLEQAFFSKARGARSRSSPLLFLSVLSLSPALSGMVRGPQ